MNPGAWHENEILTKGPKTAPAPVEYVNKHITDGYEMPKFMGPPRAELDEAWHELLAGTMMRFTDEELMLAGNATSIRHKDGGFVGGLGVSHSLHCVVSRFANFPRFCKSILSHW